MFVRRIASQASCRARHQDVSCGHFSRESHRVAPNLQRAPCAFHFPEKEIAKRHGYLHSIARAPQSTNTDSAAVCDELVMSSADV
jgi:hypothetical protein